MELCYLGSFERPLDGQRRIAIPKDWRSHFGTMDIFYLLPGRHKSIQVLPETLFRTTILSNANKVSFANAAKMQALARIGSQASRSVCDKQGRISLSKSLVKHAGLNSSTMLVGSITTIQIMSIENWKSYTMTTEETLDHIEAIQVTKD